LDYIRGKRAYRGPTAWIYDLKEGQPRLDLNPGGNVHQLAFSPDGRELASAAGEKVIRIWDVATGRERVALVGHTGAVMGVAYADKTTLVTGSVDRTVRTWDVESGEELRVFRGHKSAIISSAIDKRRGRAFSASINGEIHAWDYTHDQELRKYRGDASQFVCDPRGENLMLASGVEPALFNITTGATKRSLFERRLPSGVIACNRDGSLWATGNSTFSSPPDGVGKFLLGSNSGGVSIWDRATGKNLKAIFKEKTPHTIEPTEEFRGLSFLDETNLLAIATSRRVGIWNIESGKKEDQFTSGDELLINVAVHPTGEVVATLAEKDQIVGGTFVSIWKGGATEPLRRLSGQYFPIRTLMFDDRDRLWSVSAQKLVVWDWKTGDIVRQFWLQPCSQGAVNPAQTRLATAGINGELMLWDVESGQQVLNLPAFKRTIDALTFDLTGEHLIATGDDGEPMTSFIKVWDAPRKVVSESPAD
jgi:WD40 repeat protein